MDKAGECPLCGGEQQKLATIRGDGWLHGRSWDMCYRCYGRLRNLLDRAAIREAQGIMAPPTLNEHERAICDLLGLDPDEMQAQIPPSPLTAW